MNANKQDAGGLLVSVPLDTLAQIIGSMRNFADVADTCTVTEVVNGPPAIRAWADMLQELANGEQCRAASGDSLERIASELDQQPVFPSTQARALWYAGLADRIRALSRGVPEGK